MASQEFTDDYGIEVLKKAGRIPDTSSPTQYALRTTPTGSDGTAVEINSSGQMHVVMEGLFDSGNSTTTPLSAGATYTGTSIETLEYAIFFVTAHSDVASATDGLCVEVSTNNSTWHVSECFTVPANTNKTYSFQCDHRYVRVKFTNGGTNQSSFELSTIFKKTNSKPSSHRIQDSIIDDDDAELVKAVITGQRPDGTFVNFQSTEQGNFKVAVEEYGDTPSIDSFARLRISEPFTIFDSKQLHDKQPLFWDETTGGSATSTHSSANAAVDMTVTASASDFVIRQTKQRFNYQPGKSQLVFFTFRGAQVTGLTKRIGYFDGTGTNNLTPNNGIFFETDGTLSWNIAKNGSTTETVTQANWNVDKLDGTGNSGITLDEDATQIGIIDFEWLGVGRIRVGFVINGLIIYCHYFNHANDPTFTSVYMSTPNLPLRYTIETDGTNGGTLSHICSSVISEGGIEKTGVLRNVDTAATPLTSLAASTTYAVVGVRLKTAYSDISVLPESMAMMAATNDRFRWALAINPTIAGTFTYSDLTNSAVQTAVGTNTNTVSDEGTVIASGYASAQSRQADNILNTALKIGQTIGGTRDELVLLVTSLGSNLSIYGSLNFRELL